MTYNPFRKKRINELEGRDLVALVSVPEGWFVEYKREPCTPRDYAKAISALANARGGWLFVGIAQDKRTRTPSNEGRGVPSSDVSRLLDSVRDAVGQNLSPPPLFDMTAVAGPIPDLGISEDHSVLVIQVPQSENTPHVHASGRVYIRQADSATPLEATKRSELDHLYERAVRLKSRTINLLERGFDPVWAKEFDVPWVYCSFTPSVRNRMKPRILEFEEFRAVMHDSSRDQRMLPDVYPSTLGFVARNHSSQQNPGGPALTLEYAHDGSAYVSVPLSAGMASAFDIVFLSSLCGQRFLRSVREQRFGKTRIVDGSFVFVAANESQRLLHGVLRAAGMSGPYLARLHGMNFLGKIPFFNSTSFVDWCTENTMPIIHRDEFRSPWSSSEWSFIDDIRDDSAIIRMFFPVLEAMGIPDSIVQSVIREVIRNIATSPKGAP